MEIILRRHDDVLDDFVLVDREYDDGNVLVADQESVHLGCVALHIHNFTMIDAWEELSERDLEWAEGLDREIEHIDVALVHTDEEVVVVVGY